MTGDIGRFPSGFGYEWRGDWKQRLRELLAARGFTRLTDYAAVSPLTTLEQMSTALGDGDVAPVQLQWTLVEEAEATGDLEKCARDLLTRSLHEVADGWPADREWETQKHARHALIAWQGSLREPRYDGVLEQITIALLDATNIPAGWKPTGSDDPIIVDVFKRHWLSISPR